MADKQKADLFDLEAISAESTTGIVDPFLQDDQETSESGEKFVVFEIENTLYAIPSGRVAEVVRMLPVTVIPNIPGWFLGIANLRGDILSVIDLAGVIGDKPADSSTKSKLVVLSSENTETNLAFKVERLREIVALSEEQIESPSPDQKHLAGIADYKSTELKLLDVQAIISTLSLR